MEPVTILLPGAPVPKGRPRFRVVNGHASPYTPTKTRKYEERVKQAARIAMIGRSVLTGPVRVRITVNIEVPQSKPKWWRQCALEGLIRPHVQPDIDNYAKCAIDGCNKIVFKNDGQISDLLCMKRYAAEPSLVVTVDEVPLPERPQRRPSQPQGIFAV